MSFIESARESDESATAILEKGSVHTREGMLRVQYSIVFCEGASYTVFFDLVARA